MDGPQFATCPPTFPTVGPDFHRPKVQVGPLQFVRIKADMEPLWAVGLSLKEVGMGPLVGKQVVIC